MKIKKKLFKKIKDKYKLNIIIANKEMKRYQEYLSNYEPKYGSKQILYERYIYHKTVAEAVQGFLNDLKKLENDEV